MIAIERTILECAVESSTDGIVITDARAQDNPIIYINPAFERMTGYTSAETIGRNCRFLQHTKPRQAAADEMREAIATGRPCLATIRNIRKDGTHFWNEVSISPIRNAEGVITNYLGIQKDVTERILNEKELKNYQRDLRKANRDLIELVRHDIVTELYNRRYFSEIFMRDWQLALREGKYLALIVFDIDFFKQYNDTYGHQAGDVCLKLVAQTIRDGLKRGTDVLARYGGEEFIGLLFDLTESRAASIAAAITASVKNQNIVHAGSTVAPCVTLSAGVASCVPHPEQRPDDLIKAADDALYQAKNNGRNRIVKHSELSNAGKSSG
jgi:two-component system cell cycle response regulator